MNVPAPVLAVEGLSVRYGRKTALREVSLRFEGGALGLLGPNGAGKSSLLRSLLGLVRPAAGRARVFGLDAAHEALRVRLAVGYVSENDGHVPGLTGLEMVTYCGRLCGLSAADARRRAHEVLVYVGLDEERYRPVDGYSRGMLQKIKLSCALVQDPALLLLDEPSNGLDPQARGDFLELVRDLWTRKGVHVLLSSHLLHDVEAVCERVVVLAEGRVLREGTIAELERAGEGFVVDVIGEADRFAALARARGLLVEKDDRGSLRVRPNSEAGVDGALEPRRLFEIAREAATPIRRLEALRDSLEDVFLRLLGGGGG